MPLGALMVNIFRQFFGCFVLIINFAGPISKTTSGLYVRWIVRKCQNMHFLQLN